MKPHRITIMIKYYHVGYPDYRYEQYSCSINEYFLIKEGWILCEDYRVDPNDSYYLSDMTNNRKDFCSPRNCFNKNQMFEHISDAMDYAYKNLKQSYEEESFKLLKAYNEIVKKIKNTKEYNG